MAERRLQGIRVLVVDDDPDILGSIGLALRGEGAETDQVGDGNAAVHSFQTSRPDIVVLDMMLPKRSGFLVLEKIQEAEDPPPVVMVTANQGRRHMAYAQSLGVAAYLNKPVSLQRLLDVVAESVGRGAAG